MATDAVPPDQGRPFDSWRMDENDPLERVMLWLCKSLSSLNLTVLLFALAMFIIQVGTLAQDKQGMWEVISEYFRAWVSWVEVPVFFPSSWFPNLSERMMSILVASGSLAVGAAIAAPFFARWQKHIFWLIGGAVVVAMAGATAIQSVSWGGFLCPGGATIGIVLVFNLLAAHIIRFKIQATGTRLTIGLVVILVGALVTWLVIATGHNKEGLQTVPFFGWATLWLACKVAVVLFSLALLAGFIVLLPKARTRMIEVVTLGTSFVLMAALALWLWLGGDAAYLGDAGMRILWQLIQSTGASIVLLVGCILVFKRRGGIVLIHAGVGLLMLGEWFVSWYAVEERMTIKEGETVNFAVDTRHTELAVVDPSFSDTEEDVVVVPGSLLLHHEKIEKAIQHEDLPFDVRVVDYVKASRVRLLKEDEEGTVTTGLGVGYAIKEMSGSAGADSRGTIDFASAYIALVNKDDGEEIGTYLVSQFQAKPDRVNVGDKTYHISLRFKHTYKPYSIHLFDFRKDDYLGTSKAMNFSSDIRLVDESREVDREIRIWMNNPLRYAGETFYQQNFIIDPHTGEESTELQVVTNTGWMIPYVSCMVVFTGMAAHFFAMLMRFLRRRTAEAAARDAGIVTASFVDAPEGEGGKKRRKRKKKEVAAKPPEPPDGGATRLAPILVPLVVVLLAAGWLSSKTRAPSLPPDDFDLAEFGKLPVVFEGRVKPFDTLARNTLRKISDYNTFKDEEGERQPALRWLLDVIADPEVADNHKVFRIYNLEILDTLGLKRRKGFQYSLAEIRGTGSDDEGKGWEKLNEQIEKASHVDDQALTFYQKKALELSRRFQGYWRVSAAFQEMQMPDPPSKEELEKDRQTAVMTWYRRVLAQAAQEEAQLERMQSPLAVPNLSADEDEDDKPWRAYAAALNEAKISEMVGQKPGPAFSALQAVFEAYQKGDAEAFNENVAKYRQLLAKHDIEKLDLRSVAFETSYNRFSPFYYCMVLYGFAFALAFGGCLGWKKILGRSAFWLLIFILCIHTVGIISRIYISGRPPITNLYSSAVTIAWMCVAVGLIFEAVFRLGFGNVEAAASGFSILLIAQFLGLRGDTFTVLQAVLDTQFWLTLHVIAIGVGYAATFVAGLFGIIYIITGFFTPSLDAETNKSLTRMTYGTLCFAIFFSFWGTVLGGLWADDSWGRFWGWDPKENGALIIVLWNAIILHARWAGTIRNRGLAVLAVGGNIVTSWSWFGVNELGVGLHAYGFTEGVLLWLSLVVASQLVIIGIGSLPKELWRSFKDQDEPVTAETV